MSKTKIKIDRVKLDRIAFILKTIAHPTRLAIVQLLDHNEYMSVNELMEQTGCEQSLLSHHLSNMRVKGLLKSERDGQNILYSLKEKDLVNIVDCIEHCKCNM